MNRWKKELVPILSVLCGLSVIIMIIVLCTLPKAERGEFVPPPFDPVAIKGTPEPPEDSGWSELYQDGMSYRVGIAGNLVANEGVADIYFSNSESNSVWLKLRVLDEKGKVIGETGLIKPGEYIQSIKFDENVKDGKTVKLKIMAYQPETYYSEGSIVLNTKIKVID